MVQECNLSDLRTRPYLADSIATTQPFNPLGDNVFGPLEQEVNDEQRA
jgi:hypothetical protein